MIIVLLGQSCSGKTTIAKRLEEMGYERIITYTTRTPRKNEQEGKDYHFVSKTDFLHMLDSGKMAEYAEYDASYGHVYYGSAECDYNPEKRKVVVLNPEGLLQLKRNLIPHFSVFLDIPVEEMEKRITKRGDSKEEFYRRLTTDAVKFDHIREIADLIITEGSVDEIAKKIVQASKL